MFELDSIDSITTKPQEERTRFGRKQAELAADGAAAAATAPPPPPQHAGHRRAIYSFPRPITILPVSAFCAPRDGGRPTTRTRTHHLSRSQSITTSHVNW